MSEPSLPDLDPIKLDEFEFDVNHYLRKSYDDVGEAAEELPALIEWTNSQLQRLVEGRIIIKQEIKEVEGKAYLRLKGGVFKATYPEIRVTDDGINAAVALEESVKAKYREFAIYSGWTQRLTNLLFVLQAKLDMVRSTEATRRNLIDRSLADES